jgi:hypothetical protein
MIKLRNSIKFSILDSEKHMHDVNLFLSDDFNFDRWIRICLLVFSLSLRILWPMAHTYNPSYSRGRDQEDHV